MHRCHSYLSRFSDWDDGADPFTRRTVCKYGRAVESRQVEVLTYHTMPLPAALTPASPLAFLYSSGNWSHDTSC